MKKGDPYRLACGHEGKIVWISPDAQSFCVRGTHQSCRFCGKISAGVLTPTMYTISLEGQPKRNLISVGMAVGMFFNKSTLREVQ